MAVEAFLIFIPSSGDAPKSDAVVDLGTTGLKPIQPFPDLSPFRNLSAANLFPVRDWSTEVEQTVNLTSQSTGAGAGKIVFDALAVTRLIDSLSPSLFAQAAAGTPYRCVDLLISQTGGANPRVGVVAYRFGLCAVATVAWSPADEVPVENLTLQYGGVAVAVAKQDSRGVTTWGKPLGWNRIKNIAWDGASAVATA